MVNESGAARGARFMAAARLIRGVSNGQEPADLYESGIYSYGIIADSLENPGTARTISEAARVPYAKVRPAARRIIEMLLWNRQDNPFTSLGLSPFATPEEIHGRWKKLIAIYHPDRHMDDPGYQGKFEEAAKKINEAYKRAAQIKNKSARKTRPVMAPVSPARRPRHEGHAGQAKVGKGRFIFTPTPSVVIMALALLALFFILLLLGGWRKNPSFYYKRNARSGGIILLPEGIRHEAVPAKFLR